MSNLLVEKLWSILVEDINRPTNLAVYPGAVRDAFCALESFNIGCHHRITRRALVEWLGRNGSARRAGEPSA